MKLSMSSKIKLISKSSAIVLSILILLAVIKTALVLKKSEIGWNSLQSSEKSNSNRFEPGFFEIKSRIAFDELT